MGNISGCGCVLAEEYNRFQARFSKFSGEIFNCVCIIQLPTAIQLYNNNLLFQLPTRNRCFQRLTTVSTFNWR